MVVHRTFDGDLTVGGVITPTGGIDGYVPEAPNNGVAHVRRGLGWVALTWSEMGSAPSFITDAPSDGNMYARKDGAWFDLGTQGWVNALQAEDIADLQISGLVTASNSIQGGGSVGSFATFQLVNDSASPGNWKFYGTDGSGAKGFRSVDWAGLANVPSTFAPSSHAHAASDITSGTVATARLGSGTANSTTFLRGDQTYAVPSTASNTRPITKKTATYTATSSDGVILCAFSSNGDLTLPTSGLSDGQEITVIRTGGAGSVSIYHGATFIEGWTGTREMATWVWSATDSAFYRLMYDPGS